MFLLTLICETLHTTKHGRCVTFKVKYRIEKRPDKEADMAFSDSICTVSSEKFQGLRVAIDTLPSAIRVLPYPECEVFIAHLGGAMSAVAVNATAFSEPGAAFSYERACTLADKISDVNPRTIEVMTPCVTCRLY
jgi:hypothetical protein